MEIKLMATINYTSSSSKLAYLFLSLFIITCCLTSSQASPVVNRKSTEFIRTSCGATTYPGVCFRSLSAYTSTIQTSPKQLANAALSVSLTGARATSSMMSRMLVGRGGMQRGEAGAMRDCVEVIADSIDEIRRSIGEMSHLAGGDFNLKMNNIQTWVSAALTDEDTCMDGFDGMQGKVRDVVRGRIVDVAKLTSNALALINSLAATVHVTNP